MHLARQKQPSVHRETPRTTSGCAGPPSACAGSGSRVTSLGAVARVLGAETIGVGAPPGRKQSFTRYSRRRTPWSQSGARRFQGVYKRFSPQARYRRSWRGRGGLPSQQGHCGACGASGKRVLTTAKTSATVDIAGKLSRSAAESTRSNAAPRAMMYTMINCAAVDDDVLEAEGAMLSSEAGPSRCNPEAEKDRKSVV